MSVLKREEGERGEKEREIGDPSMIDTGKVEAPAKGGLPKRYENQAWAWLLPGNHWPIPVLAGGAFFLDLLVPPSLSARLLSLLLTSGLLLAFAVSDFRRVMEAESQVRYLARRWLGLSVLGLLFLFSGAKAVTLARIVGNPQQAVALTPAYDLYTTTVLIAIALKLLTQVEWVSALLERLHLRPAQTVALSFVSAAIVGALLLSLPQAVRELAEVSFLDALFTATSAVCVTGLVVKDIGRDYTLFGQATILVLIQLGGLGIMTYSALLSLLARASTDREKKILELVGATKAISIEAEMGKRLARALVAPSVLEYIELSEGYSMIQWEVDDRFVGKSLAEVGLRSKWGLNLVGTRQRTATASKEGKPQVMERMELVPRPDYVFQKGDVLVLVGQQKNLESFTR